MKRQAKNVFPNDVERRVGGVVCSVYIISSFTFEHLDVCTYVRGI